jgi:putative endopeptidase
VIVGQPTYLKAFVDVSNKTSLDTWKAYLSLHLIESYGSFLSKNFVDERFDFYGKTLSGVKEIEPRWKRGVGAVERSQGESLGKLYVAQYFPAERKARMEALVKNLLAAYKQSDRQARLDEPGHQEGSASQAGQVHPEDRLPEQVEGLLGWWSSVTTWSAT